MSDQCGVGSKVKVKTEQNNYEGVRRTSPVSDGAQCSTPFRSYPVMAGSRYMEVGHNIESDSSRPSWRL